MMKTTVVEIPWPRLGLRTAVLMGLLGILLAAFLLSLALGSVRIPLDNVVRILLGRDAG